MPRAVHTKRAYLQAAVAANTRSVLKENSLISNSIKMRIGEGADDLLKNKLNAVIRQRSSSSSSSSRIRPNLALAPAAVKNTLNAIAR
jgi:hypothetical protein